MHIRTTVMSRRPTQASDNPEIEQEISVLDVSSSLFRWMYSKLLANQHSIARGLFTSMDRLFSGRTCYTTSRCNLLLCVKQMMSKLLKIPPAGTIYWHKVMPSRHVPIRHHQNFSTCEVSAKPTHFCATANEQHS